MNYSAWVLEEHDDTREMYAPLLERRGFDVIAFGTTAQLFCQRSHRPDVVILDAWTAQRLELPVAARVPLDRTLVTSTSLRQIDLWRRLGAAHVLLKPVAGELFQGLVCDLARARYPGDGPMRVLVIEDEDEIREEIAEALRDAGHLVETASDGRAALAVLSERKKELPELILLDLLMPDMDGQRFRARQLADARLAAIPTLVLTALPIDPGMRRALGETAVLRKPFDLDALLAAVIEMGQPAHAGKRCACGREYDEESWRTLRLIGEADNGRGAGERLELRLCECKSTLAWELGRHARSVPILRSVKPSEPP
ncbi:MAG: response regulator [Myxococcales bacterium]|nr:response regulator [Myxococcales bacterium]